MQRIIWWLRRDLRLTDNVTLHYTLHDASSIIPVCILDPRLLNSDKLVPARSQFLFDSLIDPDARLRDLGVHHAFLDLHYAPTPLDGFLRWMEPVQQAANLQHLCSFDEGPEPTKRRQRMSQVSAGRSR